MTSVNDEFLIRRIPRLFASCRTPEQWKTAWVYFNLARKRLGFAAEFAAVFHFAQEGARKWKSDHGPIES